MVPETSTLFTIEQAEKSFVDAICLAQKEAGITDLETEVVVIGIEPDPTPLHFFFKKDN